MKKSILIFTAVFSFTLLSTSCKEVKKEEVAKTEMVSSEVYQCPMDCEKGKTYDIEGSCPVCKMDLKAKKASAKDVKKSECKKKTECKKTSECKEKSKCKEKSDCKKKSECKKTSECTKCEPGKCTCKKEEAKATMNGKCCKSKKTECKA